MEGPTDRSWKLKFFSIFLRFEYDPLSEVTDGLGYITARVFFSASSGLFDEFSSNILWNIRRIDIDIDTGMRGERTSILHYRDRNSYNMHIICDERISDWNDRFGSIK